MMKVIIIIFLFRFNTNVFSSEYKFVGQNYPPINYQIDNEKYGAMVEIINTVCLNITVKCTIEIQPLKRLLTILDSKTQVVAITLVKTTERLKKARFISVYKSTQAYWSLKGLPNLKSLKELKGKQVASVRGSASLELVQEHLKSFGPFIVEEALDNESLLKMLSSERYRKDGLVLVNELPGNYFMNSLNLKNIKLNFRIKDVEYGIYFSNKYQDEKFFRDFSSTFKMLKLSGKLDSIYSKYSLRKIF